MGAGINEWIFRTINKQNITRKDLEMAKKRETITEKLNLF